MAWKIMNLCALPRSVALPHLAVNVWRTSKRQQTLQGGVQLQPQVGWLQVGNCLRPNRMQLGQLQSQPS